MTGNDAEQKAVQATAGRRYPDRGLHGRVVRLIGERIVAGRIAPDDVLPRESELMDELGVSRTAIREATKVLAAKGLVSSRPKTGTRVRPRSEWNLLDPDVLSWHAIHNMSASMVTDLTVLRDLVEPMTVRLAAERATPETLAAVRAALQKMEANLDDDRAYFKADLEFHDAIFAACGNPFFGCLGPVVHTLLSASFRIQQCGGYDLSEGFGLHKDIYEAMAARDADRAEAIMRQVVHRAKDQLLTTVPVTTDAVRNGVKTTALP